MSNSWAKVRRFLALMDIRDLHSPLQSCLSSFSYSSSSNCSIQSLSIGARRWHVGEKTTQQILSVIRPNKDSENRRGQIIEYLQTLIEDAFGIKVFPFGSVPLKTYLPDGDIDLTVDDHSSSSQDLATEICYLLESEENNNTSVQVKDVLSVPAQVRVVKCTVDGIRIDISFSQIAGLCALYFFEQVDRFIGKDHLFKRSLILIKAWCYYESRILGGFHGLISTYALETMVLHIINCFHSSLHCPLAVLYKFLKYYSTFDWNNYCVGINGIVLISSLPNILVQPPSECDDLLLTDNFIWSSREAVLSSMGVVGHKISTFPVKFLNILDPLRDDNNLGRSVSKGNFYRIRSALSYGAEKLGNILMLPLENIKNGLEIFFKDTLERNGKGKRADVTVPVPIYGSEISDDNGDRDHLLLGTHYGLWFHDYGMMYPIASNTSNNHKIWSHQWMGAGHNPQFDQNMCYNFKKSPRSFDGVRRFTSTNAVSDKEKSKSRGTGTFIPHIKHLPGTNMVWERIEEENESSTGHKSVKEHDTGKECEIAKEVEIVDSPACTPRQVNPSPDEAENVEAFSFSLEEFPVLPGSKPIPIKSSPILGCPDPTLVKEPSNSLDDGLEFDSLKHSSPRSMLSEAGKHSDFDVSVNVDVDGDTTSVTLPKEQESLKSEDKLVVPMQQLLLADDLEFPPLSRPPEPVIILNKKEFPPLRSCLKSHKKNKWKKDSKEVQSGV